MEKATEGVADQSEDQGDVHFELWVLPIFRYCYFLF